MDYDCHVSYQPLHVKTYLSNQRMSKGRVQAYVVFFPSTNEYESYMNAFRRTWNVRGDSIPEELRFQHTSHPVAYAYINVRGTGKCEVVQEGLAGI